MKEPLKPKHWHERWIQTDRSPYRLHRASSDVVENEGNFVQRNFSGTAMCGVRSDLFWYPGIGSRMDAPRCKKCCQIVGLPEGNGAPYNDDTYPNDLRQK